ncbi:MAG: sugar ABC transporter permease [Anaerolineae bacterium]|nr:sugar ABC transporter permease [Anaerolineae bacterium]
MRRGTVPRRPKRGLNLVRREALTFYILISPWLLGLLLFVLGPMIVSLIVSFSEWDLLSPAEFVGLQNYERMFTRDPLFWQSLKVTAVYTAVYVPLELAGGLVLALLMNQKLRFLGVFRTIYYLPSVLPGVAFVVLWMWILHPDVGLLNTLLGYAGIEGPRWLADPDWALPALLLMSTWGLGRTMVIYLASLQGIPQQLYEAAAIDGAGPWPAFWRITLPLLTPTIFFNLVLSIISTFQTFTSAFVATDGGPLDATLFYVLYLFRQAFQFFNMGYASAMAWILFLLILALTLVIVRSSGRWVYYEGERP